MFENEKIAIISPTYPGDISNLEKFITQVEARFDHPPSFVFGINNDPKNQVERHLLSLSKQHSIHLIDIGSPPQGYGLAYLKPMELAIKHDTDIVIEMDSNGSHHPKDIHNLISPLQQNTCLGAVFSDKLHQGTSHYPLRRTLVSRVGTQAANWAFGIDPPLPDLTSGFEVFRTDVLARLFSKVPAQDWITVRRGPSHFFQTEMRLRLLRQSQIQATFIPITHGSPDSNEPSLPLKTILRAFTDLLILRRQIYAQN